MFLDGDVTEAWTGGRGMGEEGVGRWLETFRSGGSRGLYLNI